MSTGQAARIPGVASRAQMNKLIDGVLVPS
jgi:hypothetical protein